MKPIDDLAFWKARIDTARKEHFSVYVTSDQDWSQINEAHEKVLKTLTGKILDAGCGYGRASEHLADYTGVDFSPDFINLAKSKYPTKEFMVGNLKSLPFKDGEFEWAVCISIRLMVINNLGESEWAAMEKELKRVAKKILVLEYEDHNSVLII